MHMYHHPPHGDHVLGSIGCCDHGYHDSGAIASSSSHGLLVGPIVDADAAWIDAAWIDAAWIDAAWIDAAWIDAAWIDAAWIAPLPPRGRAWVAARDRR